MLVLLDILKFLDCVRNVLPGKRPVMVKEVVQIVPLERLAKQEEITHNIIPTVKQLQNIHLVMVENFELIAIMGNIHHKRNKVLA